MTPRRWRIAILIESAALGGAERQALLLASRLTRHSAIAVTLCCCGDQTGPVLDLAAAAGIRVVRPPRLEQRLSPLSALRWLAALAVVLSERPDRIVPFCTSPNILAALADWALGRHPQLWNQRDAGIDRAARIGVYAARRSRVAAANAPTGAVFLARLGIEHRRIVILPNGVDLPPAMADHAAWRSRMGAGEGTCLLLMAANLHPGKCQDQAIDVLCRLRKAHGERDWRLVLAGRDDGRGDSLRTFAAATGVGEQVVFAGAVEDMSGLYAAADVMLFPASLEGTPNVVIEALACGCPVAATDLATLRPLRRRCPHLALAPPGDLDALAAAVLGLLDQSRPAPFRPAWADPDAMARRYLRLLGVGSASTQRPRP